MQNSGAAYALTQPPNYANIRLLIRAVESVIENPARVFSIRIRVEMLRFGRFQKCPIDRTKHLVLFFYSAFHLFIALQRATPPAPIGARKRRGFNFARSSLFAASGEVMLSYSHNHI